MGRAHEVRKAAMAKTAAKKTKLYSYYGKEIYLAAKAGGPEPDGNLSLRRLIEKAKLIIAQNNKSALVANKGHKKYVTTKQDDTDDNKTPNNATELELDNARILKEARFDGYYAIQTSRLDICPKEVIENFLKNEELACLQLF